MEKELQSKDLRIGNLISMGEYGVQPVSSYNLYQISLMETGTKVAEYYKLLKAIKINEESLLKYGFTQCENEYWYELKIPRLGITISCNLEGRFDIEYRDEMVVIRECCYYLHQLQNLYFALTGEELELKDVSKP
jgi:hypothetical protein